ncbi:MAG: hypothetical protein VX733_08350 [Candidatus Latescibacterota bacterium]|nr:hypothetical protein [Candidatus Latescibacterota bacterium]
MRILALLSLMLTATVCDAHHFKGLPHYGYFEHYPQIPQEEFIGHRGRYEVSLVLYDFQGLRQSDMEQPDDARIFVIAFDLLDNQVYGGPALIEVLDDGVPMLSDRVAGPKEENVYQIHGALPVGGDYALRLSLLDEDIVATIPFRLSSQKIHWGRWIVSALVVLVLIAGIGARRERVIRDRRDAHRSVSA